MNPGIQQTLTVDQLRDRRVIERNNIFIPNAIPPRLGTDLLELCKDNRVEHLFTQVINREADVDQLILEDYRCGIAYSDNSLLNEMRKLARNPLTNNALQAAFDLDRLNISALSIVRMGPGCYNYNHRHNAHTANILLQDNPRENNSADGIYFTSAFLETGEKSEDKVDTGHMTYAFNHEPPVLFGLNARKAFIGHGVHRINGDPEQRANPDICRYVLAYGIALPRPTY